MHGQKNRRGDRRRSRRLGRGRRYAELCAGCHLAPGVTQSDIRPGLYPHPPNLAQEEMQPAQRAFVRKLPEMSPEIYQDLSRGSAP
ncbi:MAG: hypothetical protein WA803_04675 [Steroidobacteraceae bacterium]